MARVSKTFLPTLITDDDDIIPGEVIMPTLGDYIINLNLNLEFSEHHLNWLHSARQRGAYITTVIYDLIPLEYPQYWTDNPDFVSAFKNWANSIFQFDQFISPGVVTKLKLNIEENAKGL